MIEIRNLTKKFDDKFALDNIDLEIPKGKAFGLVGSNGAGKSTLLRLLTGVYKEDSGVLLIDGEKVYDNVSSKQKVFFINDETVQFQNFTLGELRDYYRCFYPRFSEELFEQLRVKIALPLNKKISKFSKGMKRQSIVIVAIACNTDYLLLDEAFDGLDPAMRMIVKHMVFDAMLDRELTLIVSSHNLTEINELCDSAAMLHNGNILFAKELDSVKGDVHKFQIVFPTNDDGTSRAYDRTQFETENGKILHFERQGSIYYIIVKGDSSEAEANVRKKNPIVFDMLPLNLEEIFIYELEVLGYDGTSVG